MLTEVVEIPSYIKEIIPEKQWKVEKLAHEERVDFLISDYLIARSHQKKQPVMDFLFEYYAFRPSALRRWSPGLTVALECSSESELPELSELVHRYARSFLSAELFPVKRIRSLQWMLELLQKTTQKKPAFGCFGMHEWAMVYKSEEIRHAQVPLRMNPEDLAAFVESRPLICTHFDAYRFFTKPAVPLNKFELSREHFADTEQAGCIHTNMDLYKWAFKLYPWINSTLILDAFELAFEARTIDMKASPYDLSEHGLKPIKIETEPGRKEYLNAQQEIYRKGIPIRTQLIAEYKQLLSILADVNTLK